MMGVATFVLRQRADRIAQIGTLVMGLSEGHIYRRQWEHPAWLQAGLDRYSSFLHVLNAVANALPLHPVPCQLCGRWVPQSRQRLHQLEHATGAVRTLSCAEVIATLPPLTWAGVKRWRTENAFCCLCDEWIGPFLARHFQETHGFSLVIPEPGYYPSSGNADVKPEGRSGEIPGQSIEKSAVRSEETPTCEPFRHNRGAEE
jgi:hypothetical protein